IDEKHLVEPEEKALYQAILATVHRQPSSVNEFLEMIIQLTPAINAFFDKVLVMAEERELRLNRLALVKRIADLGRGLADLSKLEGF
ncbi:MAG: DALR anticodon-binding domain-containing protein, partial [Anaerolineales bacterium]